MDDCAPVVVSGELTPRSRFAIHSAAAGSRRE